MNFAGIGPLELVVVLALALLVLGPTRLASTARSLGKLVREVRQSTQGLPNLMDELLEEQPGAPPPPGTEEPEAPPPPAEAQPWSPPRATAAQEREENPSGRS